MRPGLDSISPKLYASSVLVGGWGFLCLGALLWLVVAEVVGLALQVVRLALAALGLAIPGG